MSHEGLFKIIASPPLVSRMVENLLADEVGTFSNSFSNRPSIDLIALSQDGVFLLHSSGGCENNFSKLPELSNEKKSMSGTSNDETFDGETFDEKNHIEKKTNGEITDEKTSLEKSFVVKISDQKISVTHCHLKKWIDLVASKAKKILIDPSTRAETMLFFNALKNAELVLWQPLLAEEEIVHYFLSKTNEDEMHDIHQKKLKLLHPGKRQMDTFCKALLICEMAFVCNYHKLHQEARPAEIAYELQHYVHSKCSELPNTQLNCKVEHYHLNGAAKKMSDKDLVADNQAIVLTISGKSCHIDLEKQRIVVYGLKINEEFIASYNETLKSYLELKEVLTQQFGLQKKSKNLKKENTTSDLSATIEEIFKRREKKNGVAPLPYFRFSFSSDISLKYLPMVLTQIKRSEILSIFFPVVFQETVGHLSLHAAVELNERTKRTTVKILDRDHLDLLRFFS